MFYGRSSAFYVAKNYINIFNIGKYRRIAAKKNMSLLEQIGLLLLKEGLISGYAV